MGDPKDEEPGDLERYRAKRTGGSTPEPMASQPPTSGRGPKVFVVHQHDATRMHWDLRLEIEGVLVSWAVPKPPALDPDIKRYAVKVENHPLEYAHFEGVIPKDNYGAGAMIAWDRGMFRPLVDPAQGMRDGEIKFELYGYKLRGSFTLIHTGKGTRGRQSGRGSDDWLLIKKRDEHATTEELPATSVLSGLTVQELFAGAPAQAALVAELATLGAPRKILTPANVEPMLCQTADAPFSSPDWVFELKYDGFRMLAFGGAGAETQLRYRSGKDPTPRYPELTSAVRALPVPGLVLDGELVVFSLDGKPDFHALAERAQMHRTAEIARSALVAPVSFVAFDLIGAAGYDLRGLPLLVRKALLRRLIPAVGPLRYADHIPEVGEAFLDQVVARGLEGVVAKRANAPYKATRSKDWLKVKRDPEGDFAVCGFTLPKGSRAGMGALHLCVRVDDDWRYAGKVGSGFDDKELLALRTDLEGAPAWTPTFPRPEGSAGARWVEPKRVAQVRYREWPEESHLRHPVFVRMRDDKAASECAMVPRTTEVHEEPASEAAAIETESAPVARQLKLTNQKKVFWPDDGITKGDLVAYYRAIAPWLLPYLKDRPLVLTRFPDGITGESFYQKDTPGWAPAWLRTTALWSEHSQREIHYVMIDDADGLAFVANLGAIPLHVWASREGSLEKPDYTILDLDTKQGPREYVVPLALAIHELCEQIGLPNYIKTSGQAGTHILMPLGQQCTFEQARTLAHLLGTIIERRHPTMATVARNPNVRAGKVYLDWGQNAHGQLLVAPYSVRPQPGAPVSMPLRWEEVTPDLDPKRYNVRTALARVTAWNADPCLPVLSVKPDLAAMMEKLAGLAGA
jgi:bifunctional non-homologous end joining protein LigD